MSVCYDMLRCRLQLPSSIKIFELTSHAPNSHSSLRFLINSRPTLFWLAFHISRVLGINLCIVINRSPLDVA
jgi:hypothetical protein